MIEKFKKVDPALRAEIDSLIEAAATADGFKTEIYTDFSVNAFPDMQCAYAIRDADTLTGFLVIFAPTAEIIEVSALVHPAWRRRGCFKDLLNEATAESVAFGYHQGYIACNEASEAALAIMSHWGYALHHSEYQMLYDLKCASPAPDRSIRLVEATLDDVEESVPLLEETFGGSRQQEESYLIKDIGSPGRTQWLLKRDGHIIGFCGAYQEGQAHFVFGLGILPSERRHGYARGLLDLVASIAREQGSNSLNLDVDSDNPNAISLYQSYGFTNRSATQYYKFEF